MHNVTFHLQQAVRDVLLNECQRE